VMLFFNGFTYGWIPHSFAEMDASLTELKSVLVKNEVDLVFIKSKGETLINDRGGEVIDLIKGKGYNDT
jgi:hypothetical protein